MSSPQSSRSRALHMAGVGAVVGTIGIIGVVMTAVVASDISTSEDFEAEWQRKLALTTTIVGIPSSSVLSLCFLAKAYRCLCGSGDEGQGQKCVAVHL